MAAHLIRSLEYVAYATQKWSTVFYSPVANHHPGEACVSYTETSYWSVKDISGPNPKKKIGALPTRSPELTMQIEQTYKMLYVMFTVHLSYKPQS